MEVVEHAGLAAVAETLTEDAVHVWLISYTRELRRLPLVKILAAYLRVEAVDVDLVDGEFGRPALALRHGRSLDFNWSHSGDRALVVVAHGMAPGIDIERLRDRPRALQVADRYFRPDETARLAALPDADRSLAFLRLWTAKEAVLKALGRGIAFGLERLEIDPDHAGPTLRWLDGEDATQWQLHRLDVGAGYLGALAWRGESRPVDCRILQLPA